MNLLEQLGRQAAITPDFDALHSVHGNLTVAQVDQRCWRMARILQEANVKHGDIVALVFADERMFVIAALAATRIGAVFSCIPPLVPDHVREEMISAVTASRVIMDSGQYAGKVPSLTITMDQLATAQAEADRSLPVPDSSDLFALFVGSGSTGKPKIIPNSHAEAELYCELQRHRYGNEPGDTWAFFPPVHYRSPLMYTIAAISGGNRSDLALKSLPLLELIARRREIKVTHIYSSAAQILQVFQMLPPDAKEVLGGLKGLILAFSPISAPIRAEIRRRLTKNLIIAYGAAEAGIITVLMPNTENADDASVGFPVESNVVEIVDDQGNLVPRGTPGHIRLKNDQLISHYYNDPEKTAQSFRDGFFYPGDNGKLLPDGQLVFLGRSDHMIIHRGVNIYPAEVEHVLSGLEGIKDVAVVPLKDPYGQEFPVCAISIERDVSPLDLDIVDFSEEKLGMRAPQKFFLLDDIPRTPQGKLDRDQLYAEMQRVDKEHQERKETQERSSKSRRSP